MNRPGEQYPRAPGSQHERAASIVPASRVRELLAAAVCRIGASVFTEESTWQEVARHAENMFQVLDVAEGRMRAGRPALTPDQEIDFGVDMGHLLRTAPRGWFEEVTDNSTAIQALEAELALMEQEMTAGDPFPLAPQVTQDEMPEMERATPFPQD